MNTETVSAAGPPRPKRGVAIASLVLGIVGLFLSVFVVGGILGCVGLALGLTHILGKHGRSPMAWWGASLSLLSIIAAGCMVFAYVHVIKMVRESLGGMPMSGETWGAWEGVLAPELTITNLEGNPIRLSELKGKRVVLDFWATWCGPCVKEIPEFIKLRNETPAGELVIIGISQEDRETLRAFVKKKGVNYSIASASNLPEPFKSIQAIPTTFFIDRKGVIQSVAVGGREYAELRSLALAKDFEGVPLAKPATNPPSGIKDAEKMLQPVLAWGTNVAGARAIACGDWEGAGESQILLVAGSKLHVFDPDGIEKRVVSLPGDYSVIEYGRHQQKGARLVGFSNWGQKLEVIDSTGKQLWSYSALMGIDGAHWGDLDGDGTDELVVGMNGFGGLQALSADGKGLWHASLANVWSQAVIPARRGQALVFASEAGGTVRVFDAQGKAVRTLRPDGAYYTRLVAAPARGSGQVQILALGQNSGGSGEQAIAFDGKGQVAWSSPVKASGGWVQIHFAAGDVLGDGRTEWAFVDPSGALNVVTTTGERLVTIPNQSGINSFILVPAKTGKGLLVTLRGATLQAYSFQ